MTRARRRRGDRGEERPLLVEPTVRPVRRCSDTSSVSRVMPGGCWSVLTNRQNQWRGVVARDARAVVVLVEADRVDRAERVAVLRAPARPRSRASPPPPPARAPSSASHRRPVQPGPAAHEHARRSPPAAPRPRSWRRPGAAGRAGGAAASRPSGGASTMIASRFAKPASSTPGNRCSGAPSYGGSTHEQHRVDQREGHERRPLPGAAKAPAKPPVPDALHALHDRSVAACRYPFAEFTPPVTGDPGRWRKWRRIGDPGDAPTRKG